MPFALGGVSSFELDTKEFTSSVLFQEYRVDCKCNSKAEVVDYSEILMAPIDEETLRPISILRTTQNRQSSGAHDGEN
jgi:hypothetical protein